MNLLAYADGKQTLLDIAELISVPAWELREQAQRLAEFGLLDMADAAVTVGA
jgi:aminopeptidase-like protein